MASGWEHEFERDGGYIIGFVGYIPPQKQLETPLCSPLNFYKWKKKADDLELKTSSLHDFLQISFDPQSHSSRVIASDDDDKHFTDPFSDSFTEWKIFFSSRTQFWKLSATQKRIAMTILRGLANTWTFTLILKAILLVDTSTIIFWRNHVSLSSKRASAISIHSIRYHLFCIIVCVMLCH